MDSGGCEMVDKDVIAWDVRGRKAENHFGPRYFECCGMLLNGPVVRPAGIHDILDLAGGFPYDCTMQISFLRLLGVSGTILCLTSKAGLLIQLLRSMHPNEVIGTMDDHLWMGTALGIVVAPPDHDGFNSPSFISAYLAAIIFPEEKDREEALPLLSAFYPCFGVELGPNKRFRDVPKKNWFAQPWRHIPTKEVRALLQGYLPDALECPGLGDGVFRMQVACFSESASLLVSDWSGLFSLLPGILVAAAANEADLCLVVAPASRVMQLLMLIIGLRDYFGIRGVSVGRVHFAAQSDLQIAVGTPDKLLPVNAKLLVLVETDVLLSQGYKSQVEKLLALKDVQVGLHARTRTLELDEVVSRLLPGETFSPKAGLSLDYVDFYRFNSEDKKKKVALVHELWRVFGRMTSKMQLAIYCRSPESVKELGRALEGMGIPVCLHHTGMPKATLDQIASEWDVYKFELLITDIFDPACALDIVLFDLPSTPECLVRLVSRDRNRGRGKAKITVSIVNNTDDEALLEQVAQQYHVCFQTMPEKLPQLYLRSVRRRR